MIIFKFRNIYMNKIDKNIDLISKMLYEDNKDITYISRWMRMSAKVFIKVMNRWLRTKKMNKIIKINNQNSRL